MQKRVFVHVGTHKTGTTSIQFCLHAYRDKLKAEGLLVPHAGTLWPGTGHHNIAWEMINDHHFKQKCGTLADLAKELSSASEPRAVISSEDFEYMSFHPNILKMFDSKLEQSGYEPTYVVYFRQRRPYAESLHAEMKKNGLKASFDDMWRVIQTDELYEMNNGWRFEFNQKRFVDRWQSIVQRPMIVMSYELSATTIGVVPSMLALMGVSSSLIQESRTVPRLNARPSQSK